MEPRTSVVIYCRVSTSRQDTEHQLKALRDYSRKNHYNVVKEFSEQISGAKKIQERLASLGNCWKSEVTRPLTVPT